MSSSLNCQSSVWIDITFELTSFLILTPGMLLSLPPCSRKAVAARRGIPENQVKWYMRVFGTGIVTVQNMIVHTIIWVVFQALYFYLKAAFYTKCL